MRIVKAIAGTAAVLVLCGAGCGSAPTSTVEDKPIVAASEASRSAISDVLLGLSRIVAFVPPGSKVGVESCSGVGIGTPINWTATDADFKVGIFRSGFDQEMAAAGFKVNLQRSVFNDQNPSADLLIGAGIPEIQVNRCDPALYVAALGYAALMMKRSADATVTVDWEVYDSTEHKVIYRTRTQGQGTGIQGNASIEIAVQQAFQHAARNLARDVAFRDTVVKFHHGDDVARGDAGTPLGPPGAGGSEAPPPSHYTIARVPLSTKPFSENATDIRMHVGTVMTNGGHGSGFFIADDLLLTNRHVVTDQKFVKVRMVTGRELVGEVLATNTRRDVALVKTEKTGLKGLPVRDDEAGVGSTVFVIGTPLDLEHNENTVTSGIISAYRETKGERYIQSDVMVQHGNSGGPMFDDKGNIIGITVSGQMNNNVSVGINFFIPINDALQVLNVEKKAPAAAKVSALQ